MAGRKTKLSRYSTSPQMEYIPFKRVNGGEVCWATCALILESERRKDRGLLSLNWRRAASISKFAMIEAFKFDPVWFILVVLAYSGASHHKALPGNAGMSFPGDLSPYFRYLDEPTQKTF